MSSKKPLRSQQVEDRRDFLFALVVYCAWHLKRAVMVSDLAQIIRGSPKMISEDLKALETQRRIVRTTHILSNERKQRVYWLPKNRALDKGCSTNKILQCEFCGQPSAIIFAGYSLCQHCARGYKDDDGQWIIHDDQEQWERYNSYMSIPHPSSLGVHHSVIDM